MASWTFYLLFIWNVHSFVQIDRISVNFKHRIGNHVSVLRPVKQSNNWKLRQMWFISKAIDWRWACKKSLHHWNLLSKCPIWFDSHVACFDAFVFIDAGKQESVCYPSYVHIVRTIDWSTVSVFILKLTPCFFVFLSTVYFGIFSWFRSIGYHNIIRSGAFSIPFLCWLLLFFDRQNIYTISTQFQTKYCIKYYRIRKGTLWFSNIFSTQKKERNTHL